MLILRGMTDGICFFNETWLDLAAARLPITDLSITRGYAVFDFLRTYQRCPFHLQEHLYRLEYSARQVHLQLPYSLEKIGQLIHEGILQTAFPEVAIKILITAGISQNHFLISQAPELYLIFTPLVPFDLSYQDKGIHVITTRLLRPIPQAKTTCYLPAAVAIKKAHEQNAADAIYVNAKEELLEGLTSNLFVIQNGYLISPDSPEILPGITREVVKTCAGSLMPIKHESLPLANFHLWDEMFLTSSIREITPVTFVDHQAVGKGTVGFYTKELIRRFNLYSKNM